MAETAIEWTDASWNPIGGCSIESPGCTPCYAQALAGTRLRNHPLYAGTTTVVKGKPVFNGHLTALPQGHAGWRWPETWRGAKNPVLGPGMPSLIFVGDMSDLFHPDRPRGYAVRIWQTAYRVQGRHILQLLTKRPEVMLAFVRNWMDVEADDVAPVMAHGPDTVRAAHTSGRARLFADYLDTMGAPPAGAAFPTYDWMEGPRWWPDRPTNVWLGFSAERQAEFDARWPAMRELARLGFTIFLSYEPAIGALTLPDDFLALGRRAQVIAGGMSGREAKAADPAWFRALRDQCAAAGLPYFLKQWGAWAPVPWKLVREPGETDAAYKARSEAGAASHALMPSGHLYKLDHAPWSTERVLPAPSGVQGVRLAGKKAAGRLLDGVEHNGFPVVRHG